MIFRRLFQFLSIPFMAIILSSCSEKDDGPMRLGSNVWPGYEPLYLARDLGYIKRAHVNLVEYISASEVIRGFRNGSLDAAALTLDEALMLKETGIPIKIILVTDTSDGGDAIIGHQEIKKFSDLQGKKVGVESSALGAYLLLRALELNGMTLADIKPHNFHIDEHENAFRNKSVDAIVTFEPVRTALLRDGSVNEVFSSREIPGEIVDVIIVHEDYLDKYAYRIEQLVEGWFKGLNYLKLNPSKASRIIDGRQKVGPDSVLKLYNGLKFPTREENIDLLTGKNPNLEVSVRRLNSFLLENGLLKSSMAVNELFAEDIPGLKNVGGK